MSTQIITADMLRNVRAGMNISGVCLCRSYNVLLTKNGKEYLQGSITSGVDMPFKVWSQSSAFQAMKSEDYSNIPCLIQGTIDEYGGIVSIIIDRIEAVDGFTLDQFLPEKYNIEAYWEALRNYLSQRVAAKGMVILDKALFENKEVADRFKIEFAAKSMHDNCKGGLLAHTYKTVTYVGAVLQTHTGLSNGSQDFIDITLIGACLHDIGKILEMNIGAYQSCSVVTHTFLGAEMLSKYKGDIIEAYGEQWYYTLMSIIVEHHGSFGEPCKTLSSYIIHMADMLDSRMTLVTQKLEGVSDIDQVTVSVDDFKLKWR